MQCMAASAMYEDGAVQEKPCKMQDELQQQLDAGSSVKMPSPGWTEDQAYHFLRYESGSEETLNPTTLSAQCNLLQRTAFGLMLSIASDPCLIPREKSFPALMSIQKYGMISESLRGRTS